ncbi:hypothetical protein D3C80_1495520 [compost metagenome]
MTFQVLVASRVSEADFAVFALSIAPLRELPFERTTATLLMLSAVTSPVSGWALAFRVTLAPFAPAVPH